MRPSIYAAAWPGRFSDLGLNPTRRVTPPKPFDWLRLNVSRWRMKLRTRPLGQTCFDWRYIGGI